MPWPCTSGHIMWAISETILAVYNHRTFVEVQDGKLVGENFISQIKVHSINCEDKKVDGLFFGLCVFCAAPQILTSRFLKPLITGKLDTALYLWAVRNELSRTTSHKAATSSTEEISGRPRIRWFSISPKFRKRFVHLAAVLYCAALTKNWPC